MFCSTQKNSAKQKYLLSSQICVWKKRYFAPKLTTFYQMTTKGHSHTFSNFLESLIKVN